ncbi:hypothetical protein IH979_03050, partial [Patescibacteria group bacterium]|nr:hypothetical protein [Patescibacteria group bacterium]
VLKHAKLELVNEAKGLHRLVEFGLVDDGQGNSYPGIRYWEHGGGGSVSVPYAFADAEFLIGVVRQRRLHMGGEVDNLPRGYLKPGLDHFQTVQQELFEEIGEVLHPELIGDTILLAGEPVNPNSAVFDTSEPEEGAVFFAVEVSIEALKQTGDNCWRFIEGIVKPNTQEAERILGCTFIPWRKAVALKDGFTSMGVARLLAHLDVNPKPLAR